MCTTTQVITVLDGVIHCLLGYLLSFGELPAKVHEPLENPQTLPVPQDEDEREPMFIQAHDPDYVPEPVYPEYIPLEDDHEFPAEEQPLPPIITYTVSHWVCYLVRSAGGSGGYGDDERRGWSVDYPWTGEMMEMMKTAIIADDARGRWRTRRMEEDEEEEEHCSG
ncbi:hypothetical protein Tco_0875958 [Tanacetum coccineum]|uniref:Uncharacterized protein n=1 Tax=Tanacetum coccineum TaxID=301880 RepID=A0ABQ5BTP6_9ASTR